MAKNLGLSALPDVSWETVKRRRSKKPLTARECRRIASTAREWPRLFGPAWSFDKQRQPIYDTDELNRTNLRFGCPAVQVARLRKVATKSDEVGAIYHLVMFEYGERTNRDYVTDLHRNPHRVAREFNLMASELS